MLHKDYDSKGSAAKKKKENMVLLVSLKTLGSETDWR
jgi:hypothetical protein